jgi:sulfur carrier protein ThiS
MRVYVNDKPVEIFEGARVCDALNKYYARRVKTYDPGLARIFDSQRNIIFQDGSLSEYDRIYIVEPLDL